MTTPITGRWLAPPSIFPAWVEALIEENRELRKRVKELEGMVSVMGTDLQRLRDEAENRSRVAAANGDRDSADAWERIGLAIVECLEKTKHDMRVIEARTGLFGLRA